MSQPVDQVDTMAQVRSTALDLGISTEDCVKVLCYLQSLANLYEISGEDLVDVLAKELDANQVPIPAFFQTLVAEIKKWERSLSRRERIDSTAFQEINLRPLEITSRALMGISSLGVTELARKYLG